MTISNTPENIVITFDSKELATDFYTRFDDYMNEMLLAINIWADDNTITIDLTNSWVDVEIQAAINILTNNN